LASRPGSHFRINFFGSQLFPIFLIIWGENPSILEFAKNMEEMRIAEIINVLRYIFRPVFCFGIIKGI